nr:MAG TPA: hypothetical protein [Caudoviricetes sp.]
MIYICHIDIHLVIYIFLKRHIRTRSHIRI